MQSSGSGAGSGFDSLGKFILLILVAMFVLFLLREAFPALAEADGVPVTGQTQGLVAQGVSPCGTSYTVVYGDTLSEIAAGCGVSYAALVAANPQITNPGLIFPGQVITIPANTPIPPTGGQTYTVVTGDTLSQIAARFATTAAALQAANPFITNINLIYPGQVLAIPAGGSIPPTGGRTYTVVTGDTLYAIAGWYNTTVAVLQSMNPFITNVNLIYPGQVLSVP